MAVINIQSEQSSDKTRQFILDMSPEEFSAKFDERFESILGYGLEGLGEKPTVVKGDKKSYATGLSAPNDTLRINIV